MELPAIRLDPWSGDDLDLLRAINAPEMMTHLGGSEPPDRVEARHRRYLAAGPGGMFRITLLGEEAAAGSIGYWEREWRGATVWETGWSVLPAHQGRRVAVAAALQVAGLAAREGRHRWLHAYPSVDHPASNAVCRRAGFTLQGEVDFEYPPGHPMRCHDWRLDLRECATPPPR